MPKTAKPKIVKPDEDIEDIEEIEESEQDLKDAKFAKMLARFKDYDDDYSATIYKKIDRKRVLVTVMENDLPDPIEDLQKKWGGGNFRIMLHDSKNNLLDSTDINVLEVEKPVSFSSENNSQNSFDQFKSIAELINSVKSDSGNNNQIIIEMMKMQTSIADKVTAMQLDSEKRMIAMIEKMGSKKSDLSEILQIAETIEMLRGTGEPQSTVEKIFSNPMVQNMASSFINNMNQQSSQQPVQNQIPEQPVKQVNPQEIIDKIIARFPQALIDKINKNNADFYINKLYEDNKNQLDIETAGMIINTIIKNKERDKPDEQQE